MADTYGVPFESIAIFASEYDEGFYEGMKTRSKHDESQFDTESMKVYHVGKEWLMGKKYISTLYPSLKSLGYTIEVVDIKDLNSVKIPQEVKDNMPDGKLFIITKGNKTIDYVAPSEYYNLERFLNTAINGYLDEVHDISKKADKNPSSVRISYDKTGRRKSSANPSIFRKATD